MNWSTVGGRKFFATVGCGFACTVLVWFGKITPEVFQWTVIGTVGAFICGNVIQKRPPSPPSPSTFAGADR